MRQFELKTNGADLGARKIRAANRIAVVEHKAKARKNVAQQNIYRAAIGLPLLKT